MRQPSNNDEMRLDDFGRPLVCELELLLHHFDNGMRYFNKHATKIVGDNVVTISRILSRIEDKKQLFHIVMDIEWVLDNIVDCAGIEGMTHGQFLSNKQTLKSAYYSLLKLMHDVEPNPGPMDFILEVLVKLDIYFSDNLILRNILHGLIFVNLTIIGFIYLMVQVLQFLLLTWIGNFVIFCCVIVLYFFFQRRINGFMMRRIRKAHLFFIEKDLPVIKRHDDYVLSDQFIMDYDLLYLNIDLHSLAWWNKFYQFASQTPALALPFFEVGTEEIVDLEQLRTSIFTMFQYRVRIARSKAHNDPEQYLMRLFLTDFHGMSSYLRILIGCRVLGKLVHTSEMREEILLMQKELCERDVFGVEVLSKVFYDNGVEDLNVIKDVTEYLRSIKLREIEPNPGPIEELDLPDIKTSTVNSQSHKGFCFSNKVFISNKHKKLLRKMKDRLRKQLRSEKQSKMIPQVGEFLSQLLPGIPKLGLDENTTKVVENLTNVIEETKDMVEKGIDVNVKLPEIKSILDALKVDGTTQKVFIAGGACVIAIAIHQYSGSILNTLMVMIATYVVYMFGSLDPITKMITSVFSSVPDDENLVPQVGELNVNPKNLLIPVMGYLYYLAYGKTDSDNVVESFVNNTTNMKKKYEGMTFTCEYALEVITKFLNSLADITGNESLRTTIRTSFPELDQLQLDIPECIRGFTSGKSEWNFDNAQRVFHLDLECDKLIAKIPKSTNFRNDLQAAMYLKQCLRPILVRLASNNVVKNGPRKEPFGLAIFGGTEVGKTTMLPCFINDVMIRSLDDTRLQSYLRNSKDHVCYYNKKDEYMSNYHGQEVFIIDEFMQFHDAAGVPDPELQMVFDGINCKNTNISGASLEEKGSKNFTSSMFIITSNRPTFKDLKSLISTEALSRRFKVQYWQTVKPEFCTDATKNLDILKRRLDPDKALRAPKADPSHNYSMDVYEFFEYNIIAEDESKKFVDRKRPFTYYEVVDKIASQYLLHQHKQELYIKFITDMQADSLKKRSTFRDKFFSQYNFVPQVGEETTTEEAVKSIEFSLESRGLDSESFWSWLTKDKWNNLLSNFGFYKRIYIEEYLHGEIASVAQNSLEMCKSVWQIICNYPFISSAIGIMMSVGLGWKFLIKPSLRAESSYEMKPKNKVHKPKAKPKIFRSLKAQVGAIMQGHIDVINKIRNRNLYAWSVKPHGVERALDCQGYFLFLAGRIAITPNHFYNYFEDKREKYPNLKITFWKVAAPEATFEVFYSDLDHAVAEEHWDDASDELDNDIAYWSFPPIVEQHPNIVKFLPKKDNKIVKNKFPAVAIVNGFKDRMVTLAPITAIPCVEEYEGIKCVDAIQYRLSTKVGDCGQPIVCIQEQCLPLLTAIHVAGNAFGQAVGAMMYQEDALAAIDYFKGVSYEEIGGELVPSHITDLPIDSTPISSNNPTPDLKMHVGECDAIIPPNLVPLDLDVKNITVPTRSRIRKSPFYAKWGAAKYAPARLTPFLSNNVIVNPWELARKKLCPPRKALNKKLLDVCVSIYKEKLFEKSIPRETPRILTMEEAIEGIPGKLNGIPRATSAGYPWNLMVNKPGKQDFFGKDGNYDYSSDLCQALFKALKEKIEMLKQGKRPLFLYSSYLKDERRKLLKVLEGLSRLFNGVNFEFTIIFRMYFGDFLMWMEENKITNGSCIGVNPYSADWTVMTKDLLNTGHRIHATDVSNFDGSLNPMIINADLDVVEAFYHNSTEEERMIRAILWEDLAFSRHVAALPTNIVVKEIDGRQFLDYEWITTTYQYQGCQPSGTPGTAQLNTIHNNVQQLYGYASILVDHETFDYPQIQQVLPVKRINFKMFGDDCVVSIPDELKHLTQPRFRDAMAEIGVTITSSQKGEELEEHSSIEKATFLKRSFVYDPPSGQFKAPLELETILEMLYWMKDNSPPDFLPTNVSTCLRELALHKREVWDEYAPQILRCCPPLGFTPLEQTQDIALALAEKQEWGY